MSARFDSVFDALADTEEEAVNMRLRASAMLLLQEYVKDLDITQVKAAKVLGLSQPRLNDLLRGRIEKFSLDTLFKLVTRIGKDIQVEFIDRSSVA